MEKKKTTEEEYDLSYYLGGNEEDTYSKPSKQKDKFIPEREVVRKQEYCIITRCSAITAHRERSRSKTHQCQNEKGDARSIQTNLPYSHQVDK